MSAHVEYRMADFPKCQLHHDHRDYTKERNNRNEQQTESGATTPSQPQDASRRRKIARIFIDPEHKVEDVTNVSPNEEDGYEADIDSQVDYEVEEPPSDSEQEAQTTRLYLPAPEAPTQASLIKDFRNLQCEYPSMRDMRNVWPSEMRRGNYNSTVHKRSRSEGELTDSDADSYGSAGGRGGSVQPQRVRRRFHEPVGYSGAVDESNRAEFMDTSMDVDEPVLRAGTSTSST